MCIYMCALYCTPYHLEKVNDLHLPIPLQVIRHSIHFPHIQNYKSAVHEILPIEP